MAVRAGEKAFLAGDDHAFLICSRKYVYVCDALRRIADRFAEVHVIDSTDDIRFLSLSEIRMHLRGGGPVRGDAARRREEYLARCRLLPPKTIGAQRPPDPASAESTRAAPSGIIKGQSGTKKDARGKIHIGFPRSPPEEDVVLLLEHGDEGDLSTILGRVRGIILKMGTPACHMGIIARELGIPAVYGVGHQADALCHGQVVEINGETGEVVAVPAR
jgi:phosphohistidine swiveling domain-containing protein